VTQTLASQAPVPAAPKGLAARIIGVLTSPRATYADVAARPRWLGALAVVLLIGVAGTFLFLSTDIGRQAALDQQVRQMEAFGRAPTDAQYQRLEQMAAFARYLGAVSQLVFVPVMALVIAGIAFAIFNALLGGDATFKQVFAVVVHSGFIISLQQCFTLPLDYARETLSSPTNLAVFAPFLEESGFLAQMLGSIDLFLVWWAISLSIGLGVLYRTRTGPIAATMLVVYAAIAVVIAAAKTALSGA
jgi:hypothetical protein